MTTGRVRAFVRLSRLTFLGGGFVAGGFGTALASYERGTGVDWGAYALAQATVTAFHLMTHYGNEYFDRHADGTTLARPTPYSGGSGALVDGSLAPWVALAAACVCAATGTLGIVALLASGRAAAAAFGVAIAVGAWSYSAPPMRLCARGLGEVATALVVAILVPLCTYAAQGASPGARALGSLLPGAVAMFAMMLAVELPDAVADAATGKRNLVVRLGARAPSLGIAATLGAYAAVALAWAVGAPFGFVAFEVLTVPAGLDLARAFARRGRRTNDDAGVAARGVAFFFIVTLYAALAYAAAPRGRPADVRGATLPRAASVMRP